MAEKKEKGKTKSVVKKTQAKPVAKKAAAAKKSDRREGLETTRKRSDGQG